MCNEERLYLLRIIKNWLNLLPVLPTQVLVMVMLVSSSWILRANRTRWSSSWRTRVTVCFAAPIVQCWRVLTWSTCCLQARRSPRVRSLSTSQRVSHLSVFADYCQTNAISQRAASVWVIYPSQSALTFVFPGNIHTVETITLPICHF